MQGGLNTAAASQRFIVAVDQHAIHERIRLEEMLEHMSDQFRAADLEIHRVQPGLPIRLTPLEQRFFAEVPLAHRLFGKWGLRYELSREPQNRIANLATITSVPKILVNRLAGHHPELARAFHDYVSELVNAGASDAVVNGFLTDLVTTEKDLNSILRWCPSRFIHLIKSNACRGQSVMLSGPRLQSCDRRSYLPPSRLASKIDRRDHVQRFVTSRSMPNTYARVDLD